MSTITGNPIYKLTTLSMDEKEERANLSGFRTFVLVWICRFSLPLDVWKGLRFVIVALPGLFSYPFFTKSQNLIMVSFGISL